MMVRTQEWPYQASLAPCPKQMAEERRRLFTLVKVVLIAHLQWRKPTEVAQEKVEGPSMYTEMFPKNLFHHAAIYGSGASGAFAPKAHQWISPP